MIIIRRIIKTPIEKNSFNMIQAILILTLLNRLQMSYSQRLQPMHVHESLDASSFFNRTLTIGLTIARDSVIPFK